MKSLNLLQLSVISIVIFSTQLVFAANSPITLKANSTKINMKSGDTEFNKKIVINHGNLKILADTLTQKTDKEKNQEKMELTGSPARVEFKRNNENVITRIVASNIIFYPDLGILELKQQTQLQIIEDGKITTRISAENISIKFSLKVIQTIHADGAPLQYFFSPGNGKDPIQASANELSINNQSGDIELYAAVVKQGDGELRAGKIIVDGETGNLSANTGNNQSRPSFSIELDELKQQEKQP